MKALANGQNDQRMTEQMLQEPSIPKKKLADLISINKERGNYIDQLEKQIEMMVNHNQELDIQASACEKEYECLKQSHEEEKNSEEHEDEMNKWIESVQKHNGLSQQAIDSLLSMEYEGNQLEQQICLSCYSELKAGVQCKYLPCCHIFHLECINNHLKVNKLCPACQEQVIV